MQLSLSENIKIFNNAEFGEIRAALIDNEPWFVLKDVCVAFGESNYRRVAARLDDEEKGVSQINTPGGTQSMTVVNEAGLYSALFAMQPEKARGVNEEYISNRQEQLKKFKHWVTHEVLPSIRKHGMYMTDNLLETAIANPDFVIGLIQNMKAEKEKMQEQGKKFISRERKKELKEQVLLRLRQRFLPIPAEFNVIWATDRNEVWFASTQGKMIDLFMEAFLNSFELHLEQITPYSLAETMLDEAAMSRLDRIEATQFAALS